MNLRPQQYELFGEWLRSCQLERVTILFSEIEGIIGVSLPRSAFTHRTWWSNSPTHPLARAWLMAGWEVPRKGLDLQHQTVTLEKLSAIPDVPPADLS